MDLAQLGMKLALPYNFAPDWVERVLEPSGSLTEEVYLPLFWTIASTGRTWNGPRDYASYRREVARLHAAASEVGARLSFVANAGLSIREMRLAEDEILQLHADFPGSRFTLESLELAAILHARVPSMDVSPSTLAGIVTTLQALYWRRAAGSAIITVGREANRRPQLLGHLKQMGFRVKVVLQDHCVPACPVGSAHGLRMRLGDLVAEAACREGDDGPGEAGSLGVSCLPFACEMKADPEWFWVVAQKELLPGHLPKLQGLVDIVKIEGRTAPTGRLAERVAYVRAAESLRSLESPLYEEPPEAWERIATCDRSCGPCDWCRRNIVFLGAGEPLGAHGTPAVPAPAPSPPAIVLLRPAEGSDRSGLELEVSVLVPGRPSFARSGRHAVSHRSEPPDEAGCALIRGLVALLSRLEREPGFSVSDPAGRRRLADAARRLGLGADG